MEQELLHENHAAGTYFRRPQTANGADATARTRAAALYLRASTKTDKRDDDATRQRKRREVDKARFQAARWHRVED